MFSFSTYKILHLTGVFLVFMSIAPPIIFQFAGTAMPAKVRKWVVANHGIGLVIALVGGFGLLARLQIIWPWPLWVMLKLALWIIAGGLIALVLRAPKLAKIWWFLLLLLGVAAVAVVNLRGV